MVSCESQIGCVVQWVIMVPPGISALVFLCNYPPYCAPCCDWTDLQREGMLHHYHSEEECWKNKGVRGLQVVREEKQAPSLHDGERYIPHSKKSPQCAFVSSRTRIWYRSRERNSSRLWSNWCQDSWHSLNQSIQPVTERSRHQVRG